jgi:hypothetical protein
MNRAIIMKTQSGYFVGCITNIELKKPMGFGTNRKIPMLPIHKSESFSRLLLKWEQQAET